MRRFFWRKQQNPPEQPQQRWAWLGGRRVLSNTPYVMPKDALEGDRLEVQHHLLKLAAGGLYRAPIRQVNSILDVACGTGTWGREMAQHFPQARVIGMDIDESLPMRAMEVLGPSGQFPQNFRFQVADALKPLPFGDGQFDFVHARLISPFVPITRWPGVVREMVRVLKRGGLIELVELETLPQTSSPAFNELGAVGRTFMEGRGLHAGVQDALVGYLQQAGVQRIQQRRFLLGQGKDRSDTQRQQRLLSADMLAAQANFKQIGVKLGVAEDEYERLHHRAKVEVAEVGIVMPVVFCYGMKL